MVHLGSQVSITVLKSYIVKVFRHGLSVTSKKNEDTYSNHRG